MFPALPETSCDAILSGTEGVIAKIEAGMKEFGFTMAGIIDSPITGATSGNKEFLALFIQAPDNQNQGPDNNNTKTPNSAPDNACLEPKL